MGAAVTEIGNASNTEDYSQTSNVSKVVSDGSSGQVWGDKLILSDSTGNTFNTSDFGAISAAAGLAGQALSFGQSTVALQTGQLAHALDIASKTTNPIGEFLKPIAIAGGVVVAVIAGVVVLVLAAGRKKKTQTEGA